MQDFSITAYCELLDSLQGSKFQFQTVSEYLKKPAENIVLLRHDVDDRKLHSLEFARIQHARGIKGTYYFRVVPESFDEGIIKEIYQLGHEVGYHYEDMDFAKGDPHLAIRYFEKHLEMLRDIVPVSTICMHGSPKSKYDNKDVWKYYNYRDYGIIGEPYFDLDFRKIFYLTDTGRMWDGNKVSVRDKVVDNFGLSFHETSEIIQTLKKGYFPDKVMINFHPQRWTDNYALWLREKYVQMTKNWVKYWVVKMRSSHQPTPASAPALTRKAVKQIVIQSTKKIQQTKNVNRKKQSAFIQ